VLENIAKLKRYNFWDNNLPDVGFVRNDYIEKINGFIGNKLIKVLVGQRRVGKSYLLRQIIRNLIENNVNPKNIFYLNKEYTDFDFIIDYIELDKLISEYKKKLNPIGKIYIFIDEIQNINNWERLINSYSQDFTIDYEIFITGSNSKLLSGELATLLSGRYIKFEIFPFSYKEYISYAKLENRKDNYIKYLQSGGLPELFNLPNEETKRYYLSAVKDTILLRDIINRHQIKYPRLLQDIFGFLVNNASNLISINNIVNYFGSRNRKTNYETISNYIGYLEDAFLIHKVFRYSIKGKEILSGNSKYYINDLSFKNYLYAGYDYGIGYMLENLVYLELRRKGFEVYTGHLRNKEIDFVAIKNDRIVYVQVCYLLQNEETIDREFSALEKIHDNHEKIVVSLDDVNLPSRNGIKHILAWKWQSL